MKTLYFECSMGAAGDMLTAALLELHPDPAAFVAQLNALGLPGVTYTAQSSVKCGITGTRMTVRVHGEEEVSHDHPYDHDHHHHHHADGRHHNHHSLHDIEHIISHLDLPRKVQEDILAVYTLIAQAESQVHGRPVEEVHFHEVGALDAVADVTAFCLLIYELAPQRIAASPIHVGSGQVRCAHGILPVPAPATALLLRDIPTYGSQIQGELCTPTGAALLRHFVQEYGPQPPMRVSKIGYGCGIKEFPQANCVRAMLGETAERQEQIVELRCNLDDMTPEAVGFAMEKLFSAGALEVYTIPIGMKKNRPGILFTCMCRSSQRESMIQLIFQHTTTLGVRESICNRYTLERSVEMVDTKYGVIRLKHASGWGVQREKLEYDDLAAVARQQGVSLFQAAERIEKERHLSDRF